MLYSVVTLWNTVNKNLWKGYLLALILSFGPQIHRYILSVSFQRILSILALETGLVFDYARSSYTNEKSCNHQTLMACFVDCLSLLQGRNIRPKANGFPKLNKAVLVLHTTKHKHDLIFVFSFIVKNEVGPQFHEACQLHEELFWNLLISRT